MTEHNTETRPYTAYRALGLCLGPCAFAAMWLAPAPAGLTEPAWDTAALAAWMAIWWASEAVPLAATALLPLGLLPLLEVSGIAQAAAPFANPLIFLFLGGFFIALAMQRWQLHRRVALNIIARAGTRPKRLLAGAMVATAGLSMWISNTAAAMMMMPIAISLVAILDWGDGADSARNRGNFAVALLLGIAYAASIGGLGTLIGSPPNALLASFMAQTYGVQVSFAAWMQFGIPAVILLLPLTWFVLSGLAFPFGDAAGGGEETISRALDAMGPISRPEKRVAAVFALVALSWVFRPLLAPWLGLDMLSDTGVAILGAVLLFAIPADWSRRQFLLDWNWARRAPWEILLLFGGGLSLAQAIDTTGLAAWIGGGLAVLADFPAVLLAGATALLVIFLTELTSNTATTAAFLPVIGALAVAMGIDPLLLTVPAALAASCAFMLPVATPPNAIVYGTGYVTVPQMMRAGLILNLLGILAVTLIAASVVPRVAPPS